MQQLWSGGMDPLMEVQSRRTGWAWLWNQIRGKRLAIVGCAIISMIESVSLIPVPLLVRRAFDRAIPSGSAGQLVAIGCGLVALVATSYALTLYSRFATLRAVKHLIAEMRSDLIVRFCFASSSFQSSADPGEFHSLIVEDTQHVDVMLSALLSVCVPSLLLSAVFLAILTLLDWKLTLLLCLCMPPLLLIQKRHQEKTQDFVRANRSALARFSGGIQSSLHRILLAVAHGIEETEVRLHRKNIESLRDDSQRMAWNNSALTLLHSGIVTLAAVVTLVMGGMKVGQGTMTIGSLLSFYVVMSMLSSRIQQLFNVIPHLLQGNHALQSLASAAMGFPAPPYSGSARISFNGGIEFRGVTFGYHSAPLLKEASFSLASGAMVVIGGANGSGKTTIANLILGFHRPLRGELLADGIAYDQIDLRRLRCSIAYAAQEPILFKGTFWENVTYGLADPVPDDVLATCRAVALDACIARLPQGLDTPLGERGNTLSGGERQKLSIARALLRRPQLLILDEPTNHLDPESTRILLEHLSSLHDRPTVLIISQDPRVLEEIECHITVDHGRVRMVGRSELLSLATAN